VTKSVYFKNEKGLQLAGKIEMPDTSPEMYAIFAHHFAGSKDVLATTRISRALTKVGIAVLRFDFTGLGKSEGNFQDTTFSSNICDLTYAAKFLRDHYEAPELLIGHSLGGSAAYAAASLIPEIKAISSIGSPSNPAHVIHAFEDHIHTIEQNGSASLHIAGQALQISKGFLDDIRSFDLLGIIKNLETAIMVFHSPFDKVVSIEHAKIIYSAARHPKSFVSLDQADHLLTKKEDAEFVASILAVWSKRYIR